MDLKELKRKYERKIIDSATTEQIEEKLLDELEEIFDRFAELDVDIEKQKELSNEWKEYLKSEDLDNEFMYANRAC
jgi:hypothetical protein